MIKTPRRPSLPQSLPMPLWLQAVTEILLTAIGSLLFVAVIVLLGWFTLGMPGSVGAVLGGSGQLWLAGHGVGVHLNIPSGDSSSPVQGVSSLTPLGLTVVLVLFTRRAGKRLARASYEGQFWQAILAAAVTYGVIGLVVSLVTSNSAVRTEPVAATLIPLWVVILGMLWGGHRVAGSWLRLVGIDPEKLSEKYSQYSRWTGAYVVSLIRAAWVAVVGLVGAGALLTGLSIFVHWNRIVSLYQGLHAGGVGDLAVTLLQLALLPNLIIFGMAWGTGAGFSLGAGTVISPAATTTGALPSLPVLGAVPADPGVWGYSVLVLPVLAGALAGWYFIRDGENHLDEWFTLRLSWRWLAAILSGLCVALGIGLLVCIVICLLAALAHGSLGIGRFTDVGPHPWLTGVWAGITVAVGTLVGQLLGPWIERDPTVEPISVERPPRKKEGRATSTVRTSGTESEHGPTSRGRSVKNEAKDSSAKDSSRKPSAGASSEKPGATTADAERTPNRSRDAGASRSIAALGKTSSGASRADGASSQEPRRGSDGKGPLPPRPRGGSTRYVPPATESSPSQPKTEESPRSERDDNTGSSSAPRRHVAPWADDRKPREVPGGRPVVARPRRKSRRTTDEGDR
ncbi:hypothetical protein D8M21_07805 [Kocuria sp. HSID16901]|nr:hypothetical protein D8M21_07805 [Kocuria sp. HSID16901]